MGGVVLLTNVGCGCDGRFVVLMVAAMLLATTTPLFTTYPILAPRTDLPLSRHWNYHLSNVHADLYARGCLQVLVARPRGRG